VTAVRLDHFTEWSLELWPAATEPIYLVGEATRTSSVGVNGLQTGKASPGIRTYVAT
jgi:hypothetical protein